MSEIPKETLNGGYPEDNEWESLNERDQFEAEYGADLAELKKKKVKQNLGDATLGMPEVDNQLGETEASESNVGGKEEAA